MREVVRLMIVDDHASFRTAAVDMVVADARFAVVGVVDCGEAALALAASTSCDLVVMDVRMPGMGGLAAAAAIREVQPEAVVVLVSSADVPHRLVCELDAVFVCKFALTADVLARVRSDRDDEAAGGGDVRRR